MSAVVAGDFSPYLEAIRSRRIALPQCSSCQRWVWPPTRHCPECSQSSVEWLALPAGTGGVIFSFVIVHHTTIPEFQSSVPYVLGIVSVDGTDIRLVGHILCDPAEVAIGDHVEPIFRGDAEVPLIEWTLNRRG